jgi:hypothetical protein
MDVPRTLDEPGPSPPPRDPPPDAKYSAEAPTEDETTTLRDEIRNAQRVEGKDDAWHVLDAGLAVGEQLHNTLERYRSEYAADADPGRRDLAERATRILDNAPSDEDTAWIEGYFTLDRHGNATPLDNSSGDLVADHATDSDRRTIITEYDRQIVGADKIEAAVSGGDAIRIREGHGVAVQEYDAGEAERFRDDLRNGEVTLYSYSDTFGGVDSEGRISAAHNQFFSAEPIGSGEEITKYSGSELQAFREKHGLPTGWVPTSVCVIDVLPREIPVVTGHATSAGTNKGGGLEAVVPKDLDGSYRRLVRLV